MGKGFVSRMLRACGWTRRCYREVAAPDGDTRQAALVVLLTAAAAAAEGVWVSASGAGLIAITHMAAWPVWAAGLWFVGARLRVPAWTGVGVPASRSRYRVRTGAGPVLRARPRPLCDSGSSRGHGSVSGLRLGAGRDLSRRSRVVGAEQRSDAGRAYCRGCGNRGAVGPPIIFATVWALFPQLGMGPMVALVSYGVFDFNLGLGLINVVMRLVLPAAFEVIA